jgi:hypothetical protein
MLADIADDLKTALFARSVTITDRDGLIHIQVIDCFGDDHAVSRPGSVLGAIRTLLEECSIATRPGYHDTHEEILDYIRSCNHGL